jgi:signal transduction histidine kinase
MAKPIRVLIVEDSENDALLIVRELQRSGYEVTFERVDTGPAMSSALTGASWDIILSDYAMPGFSGLAALRLAEEQAPAVPFILVSGVIGEDIAVEAMRLGAHDYVLKNNLARLAPAVERELRDAEVRTRLEEERGRARREEDARKIAEATNRIKDQFLATLSHELRTPLNAILGWSEMITRGTLEPGLLSHAAEVIQRNARVQAQLINDILDMSRIITGKFQLEVRPVELVQIVEAAVESIRPAAEARAISIEREFLAPPCVVSGDPTRLQQVAWNLLSNAVKFTPKGGRVCVELKRSDSDIEIVVQDNGQGITPEFLPHVFERFRQADSAITRSSTGLGLGLSIVRHLVELHGGSVKAESDGPGMGSTFTVRLPLLAVDEGLAGAPERAGREGGGPSPAGPLDHVRVLVVDDHVDTRELIVAVLETSGATVETSSSAGEAIQKLQTFLVDVIVADIGMPGEDGYSMMRKIRSLPGASAASLPALAVTGYAGAHHKELALEAGYQEHLAKPVDPGTLVETVASLARRKSRP